MKLVTWNVNGIRACYLKSLKQFVDREAPDVLCLQETKANPTELSQEIRTLGYPYFQWSVAQKKGYSGVATFCFEPFQFQGGLGIETYDSEGRAVIAQKNGIKIYNIYFPNGGSGVDRHLFKQKFLQDLHQIMKREIERGYQLIVVGDYNIAPKPIDVYDPVGLANESGFLPEERDWFQQFLDLGFVDTFRHFHPQQAHRYTWWSYREKARLGNRGWRIDFICVTQALMRYVVNCEILDEVTGSDHCPVKVELKGEIFG